MPPSEQSPRSQQLPQVHRLPIEHPDYRYPESRNPYWKKNQLFAGRIFSDNDTEKHAGHWRERFPLPSRTNDSLLHVELGCNAGHVVVEWAARAQAAGANDLFIGLDWKFKPIFRAAEKAEKRGLQNILFFRSHAERLPYMFGPGEIDRLYLFFPDPWVKKSQWKNRYITAERLLKFAALVKTGGIFHIKTDHLGYFEWMEEELAKLDAAPYPANPWKVLERTRDLHQGHPDPTRLQIPDVTLFERLFIKDGIRINSLKLLKT